MTDWSERRLNTLFTIVLLAAAATIAAAQALPPIQAREWLAGCDELKGKNAALRERCVNNNTVTSNVVVRGPYRFYATGQVELLDGIECSGPSGYGLYGAPEGHVVVSAGFIVAEMAHPTVRRIRRPRRGGAGRSGYIGEDTYLYVDEVQLQFASDGTTISHLYDAADAASKSNSLYRGPSVVCDVSWYSPGTSIHRDWDWPRKWSKRQYKAREEARSLGRTVLNTAVLRTAFVMERGEWSERQHEDLNLRFFFKEYEGNLIEVVLDLNPPGP